MDFTPITSLALLVAVVVTIQNLIRYARATDWNGVLGVALAYIGGVFVVWIASKSTYTNGIVLVVDQPPLSAAEFADLLVLGFGIGSLAPVLVDFRKSFDNSDGAAAPRLIKRKAA